MTRQRQKWHAAFDRCLLHRYTRYEHTIVVGTCLHPSVLPDARHGIEQAWSPPLPARANPPR